MEAIKAGIQGLHVTNGMGERAGNAPLESTVINDFMPEIAINVKESSLYTVSKVETLLVIESLQINLS
jgi:D-citramalate synthase